MLMGRKMRKKVAKVHRSVTEVIIAILVGGHANVFNI